MKSTAGRILEIYCSDFDSAIRDIEQAITEKQSYSQIARGLEIKLGPRYDTFRTYFGICMPVSLNKYIRRRILTRGYLTYGKDRPVLNNRSTFFGMKAFKEKFENEFNLSLDGIYTESDLQPTLDTEEISKWQLILSNSSTVYDYKLKYNETKISLNELELLKTFLRLETYLLPAKLLESFAEMEKDYKPIFLLMLTRIMQENVTELSLSFNEINAAIVSARLYKFDDREMVGQYYVFAPSLPDNLSDCFFAHYEELLPDLFSVVPLSQFPAETSSTLIAISESKSLEDLLEVLYLSEDQALHLIWDYCTEGYLRLVK